MRISFFALLLLAVAGFVNGAIFETISEDIFLASRNAEPTITYNLSSEYVNDTESYWDGGTLELDILGGEYVADSASSDFFAIVSEVYNSDPVVLSELVFLADNSSQYVAPGQKITLFYDVQIDLDSSSGFSVFQNFIPSEIDAPEVGAPEPATFALVAFGAGMLIRRKF